MTQLTKTNSRSAQLQFPVSRKISSRYNDVDLVQANQIKVQEFKFYLDTEGFGQGFTVSNYSRLGKS